MKKVIITGVSEWLWYEVAKKLISDWVTVVWISRNKPQDLDIIHLESDFTDDVSLDSVIHEIKVNHGEFDAIINCAGVLSVQELECINIKEVKRLFDVNVFAPIAIVSWLAEQIRTNQADIVNVSSTVWLKAYEKQCAYGASKWAMRWVTENLQLEFKWTLTRVIGFNPGWFQSWIFAKAVWVPKDSLDLSAYMKVEDVATALIQTLMLPKNMEVSQITINRK